MKWSSTPSAFVDLPLIDRLSIAVAARIDGHVLHGPAHLDAEVMSALGRMWRGRIVPEATVRFMLDRLASAPVTRHPLAGLLLGAWGRRDDLRLADALYVEPAESLNVKLVTTDQRLKSMHVAEVVNP